MRSRACESRDGWLAKNQQVSGSGAWTCRRIRRAVSATRMRLKSSIREDKTALYIAPPLSTVCFDSLTGIAGASFGASHGESMGLEGVEKWVESVSC